MGETAAYISFRIWLQMHLFAKAFATAAGATNCTFVDNSAEWIKSHERGGGYDVFEAQLRQNRCYLANVRFMSDPVRVCFDELLSRISYVFIY